MSLSSLVTSFQPSLSEWLAAIGHRDEAALREEDIRKRERLEMLRQKIGLDYDRVTVFSAADFFSRTVDVETFISAHADDLCALRLVPYDSSLPKLRTRGRSLADSLSWLAEQRVDSSAYTVEFVEHSDTARWSSIIVVRENEIFGQIVEGLHFQLTQGNIEGKSYTFVRDAAGVWQWDEFDADVEQHAKDILAHLHVDDRIVRAGLVSNLQAEFSADGYLLGYFETLLWPTRLIFTDYNRLLHRSLAAPVLGHRASDVSRELVGISASSGTATGKARICTAKDLGAFTFEDGDILVADNTDVRFLPLMRRAGAVVTERGGILSHAAIVCRELGVPCVVGVRGVLDAVRDGEVIEVNANQGYVTRKTSR